MKKLFVAALVLTVCALLLAGPALAKDAEKVKAKKAELPMGQQVFTAQNCQMCHTVVSAGIGEAPKTDDEKEAALDGPPDLSLTGTGRTGEFLAGFLQKKELLNEKKHMMGFKGTEVELKQLVTWLLTLKAPEKGEKAAAVKAEAHEDCDHGHEKPEEKAEEKGHDCDDHGHGEHDKDADTDAKEGE